MSRIGRKPVVIPKGVKVEVKNGSVKVTGVKGELTTVIHPDVTVEVKGEEVLVARHSDFKEQRSLHGLFRALIANMVTGVTAGFSRKLEIVGLQEDQVHRAGERARAAFERLRTELH